MRAGHLQQLNRLLLLALKIMNIVAVERRLETRLKQQVNRLVLLVLEDMNAVAASLLTRASASGAAAHLQGTTSVGTTFKLLVESGWNWGSHGMNS